MITLNNIIDIFRDIASNHLQINTIFTGKDYDFNASNKSNFAVLMLDASSSTIPKTDNGYTSTSIDFDLKVVDLVDKDLSNQQDVSSDTLSIIRDVVIMLNQHPDYYDLNLNITNDITLNSLDGVFDEDVTGWETTITIETPMALSYCKTPIL